MSDYEVALTSEIIYAADVYQWYIQDNQRRTNVLSLWFSIQAAYIFC
jgi:hypothetical protein